jgi:hypothetical protein
VEGDRHQNIIILPGSRVRQAVRYGLGQQIGNPAMPFILKQANKGLQRLVIPISAPSLIEPFLN